jgi:hypothetical protein
VELKNKPCKDRFFSKIETAEDLKRELGRFFTHQNCDLIF